jgi:hypothetical protein
MPFLDKAGLAHLWDHIIAKLNTKADKTAKLSEFENDLEAITPEMIMALMSEVAAIIPVADGDDSVLMINDEEILIL